MRHLVDKCSLDKQLQANIPVYIEDMVPFIVRENAELGKYTLVGEAFAESFMHGEVEHLKFADRRIVLV